MQMRRESGERTHDEYTGNSHRSPPLNNNESRRNVYQSQPEASSMIKMVRDENELKRVKAEAYIN